LLGALALLTGFADTASEPPEVGEQARALGAKFAGGRRCNPEAFVTLKTLRREYGVHGVVGQAVALAYRGCDDDVAWAELFAERITDDDTDEDRLQLAAAWFAAHRWAEAYEVALPLAEAQGPQSRPAWLVGYALFQMDERAKAAPWLLGARGNVDGKKRSDAPVMLAAVQLEAGDAKAARAELTAAVERMPNNPPLHAVLATTLQRLGEADEAQRIASKARALAATAEHDVRRQRRFDNLRVSWQQAVLAEDTDASNRLLDKLVVQGPVEQVRTLLATRATQLERKGDKAAVRALQKRIRALPNE
jgi:tetratricopeptide (TPR) repeat protein